MQNTPVYSRYAVVLNIGLNDNPIGLLPREQQIGQLANLIAHHIQASGGIALVPNTVLVYTLHAATDKTEATYAIGFDAFSRAFVKTGAQFYDELKNRVHALSSALAQDAIAFTYADTGEGGTDRGQALAGPKIEAWGEFNPDLFLPVLSGSDAVRFPVLVG